MPKSLAFTTNASLAGKFLHLCLPLGCCFVLTRSLVTTRLGEVALSAGATKFTWSLHFWHSEAEVQTHIWGLAEVKEEEEGGEREEKEEKEEWEDKKGGRGETGKRKERKDAKRKSRGKSYAKRQETRSKKQKKYLQLGSEAHSRLWGRWVKGQQKWKSVARKRDSTQRFERNTKIKSSWVKMKWCYLSFIFFENKKYW